MKDKLQKAATIAAGLGSLYLLLFPQGLRLQCKSHSPQFGIRCELERKHRYEHRGEGFRWQ